MVVQNPQLRKERYLQIFGYLLVASIALFALSKVLISLPLQILRFIAFLISVPGRYDNSKVDGFLLSVGRHVREGLVSLPFVGLLFMRYLYPKPIDQLFMESLRYVDTQTGVRPYAPALAARSFKINYWTNLRQYVWRSFKKGRIGIVVYFLSLLPLVGRFVLPAAGKFIFKLICFVMTLYTEAHDLSCRCIYRVQVVRKRTGSCSWNMFYHLTATHHTNHHALLI